jgi:hypothetical protein
MYVFLISFLLAGSSSSLKFTDEQVIAHAGTKPITLEDATPFPPKSSKLRANPMTPPVKEHNAKHITISDYKMSPHHAQVDRYEVPTPQRARGDGSGKVYTKSPDYARNYEKTNNRIVKD